MKSSEDQDIEYSLLILLEEISEGFADYIIRLHRTFSQRADSFEMIILANGTETFLKSQMHLLAAFGEKVTAYCFNKKTTQAACLKAGFQESRGRKIVACGAYQQITDESFLRLIDSLKGEIDLVCPWRQHRVDPKFNQLQSRIFNWFAKHLLNTRLNDLSINVRALRRHVLEDVSLYGNMYRFLPILAEQKGYTVKEVKCEHYEERGGTGIYPLSEYVVRVIDILTIYFNTKFIRKPLRFFMGMGTIFIGSGLLFAGIIVFQKILLGIGLGDRPALLLAVFLITLGAQVTSVGLLGEIISFTLGRKKSEYQIVHTVNLESNLSD